MSALTTSSASAAAAAQAVKGLSFIFFFKREFFSPTILYARNCYLVDCLRARIVFSSLSWKFAQRKECFRSFNYSIALLRSRVYLFIRIPRRRLRFSLSLQPPISMGLCSVVKRERSVFSRARSEAIKLTIQRACSPYF